MLFSGYLIRHTVGIAVTYLNVPSIVGYLNFLQFLGGAMMQCNKHKLSVLSFAIMAHRTFLLTITGFITKGSNEQSHEEIT